MIKILHFSFPANVQNILEYSSKAFAVFTKQNNKIINCKLYSDKNLNSNITNFTKQIVYFYMDQIDIVFAGILW